MIELAGEVAEQRDLDMCIGLSQLLPSFIEEKALIDPQQLLVPSTMEFHLERIEEDRKDLESIAGSLISEVPLDSERKNIDKALKKLTADFVCSEFELKYDKISPQLFNLERSITRTFKSHRDPQDVEFKIPLFARVPLGGQIWEVEQIKDMEDREYDIRIRSKAPPITREAKKRAKEFLSDYMGVISNALATPIIGGLLFRDLQTGDARLSLETYWIPSPSDLEIEVEVIDKDPLLIGSVYDRNYLVSKWDIKGEMPYEHYLAEFIESKGTS
jgi:hypothetical protein